MRADEKLPEVATASSLGQMPSGERWESDRVASVFDDMLVRSIPPYEIMRSTVLEVGSKFVKPDTWIVDLGCSRDEALG